MISNREADYSYNLSLLQAKPESERAQLSIHLTSNLELARYAAVLLYSPKFLHKIRLQFV